MKTIIITTFILVSFATLFSCKKFVSVDAPPTSTNTENVYATDATAAAVMTGIYANMSLTNQTLSNSITNMYFYPALSSDELTLYNTNDATLFSYYTNNLTPLTPTFWQNIYSIIFVANSAIEGLSSSSSLTPAVKSQLLGEAKFVRGFCYFYLVNLYGDVPLVTSSDYKVNSVLGKSSTVDVYNQITDDLTSAESLLSTSYLNSDAFTPYPVGSEQRVRPSKAAASVMLARVYLYKKDYPNAESEASKVLSDPRFFLSNIDSAFQMNSSETIWALQPVGTDVNSNTGEGVIFILPADGPNSYPNEVYLSHFLMETFELGDQRQVSWVNSISTGSLTYYYPYKYKIGSESSPTLEYSIVLRLAETFLIRAEARAWQNNEAGAQADIDAIRKRAGLSNTIANSQADLIAEVQHQRQDELFTEWGHRWFDLKRTNNVDAVMDSVITQKGGVWSTSKSLYPIPQTELKLDPNLQQNAGY